MSKAPKIDYESRLIALRACQLAQAKGLKGPSSDCIEEAKRWADYVIKGFQPTREHKAEIILKLLTPKS